MLTFSIKIVADCKAQTFRFITKLCTNILTLILAIKPLLLLLLYIVIAFFLSATCSVSTFASNCAKKLRDQNTVCKKLSVFILTNPFKPEAKQYQGYQILEFQTATNDSLEISKMALQGLRNIFKEDCVYKKAGVIVHDISPENQLQLSMFDTVDRGKRKNLMLAYDSVNTKMGKDTVRLTTQGFDRKWKMKQEQLSPCYTTRITELLEVKL